MRGAIVNAQAWVVCEVKVWRYKESYAKKTPARHINKCFCEVRRGEARRGRTRRGEARVRLPIDTVLRARPLSQVIPSRLYFNFITITPIPLTSTLADPHACTQRKSRRKCPDVKIKTARNNKRKFCACGTRSSWRDRKIFRK